MRLGFRVWSSGISVYLGRIAAIAEENMSHGNIWGYENAMQDLTV